MSRISSSNSSSSGDIVAVTGDASDITTPTTPKFNTMSPLLIEEDNDNDNDNNNDRKSVRKNK